MRNVFNVQVFLCVTVFGLWSVTVTLINSEISQIYSNAAGAGNQSIVVWYKCWTAGSYWYSY